MPVYSVLWKDRVSTSVGRFEFETREKLEKHIEKICSEPPNSINGTKAASIVEVPEGCWDAYDIRLHNNK